MNPPRILVVDDDEAQAKLVRTLLTQGGEFEAEIASDGAAAISAVEAQRPDLILLDVLMPGLTGYDVLANLRGRPETRDIPILILSGLGGEGDRVRCLAAGGDDFLSKPIGRSELLARIRAHLRLKRVRDEIDAARIVASRAGSTLRAETDLRRRLSATIAADLRVPLTVLDLNLCALRREIDAVERPDLASRVEVMESTLSTLARLAGELVTLSDMPTVRLAPREQWLQASSLMGATLGELDREAARAGKQVLWALVTEIPVVKTDAALLRQVVSEATRHALAMSREKGVVEVEVAWHAEPDELRIAVSDGGAGLPSEVCEGVFQPSLSGRRDSGPFAFRGAGISFCRMAVESLGGKIWIEPRTDAPGTVSRLVIPMTSEASELAAAP